jgi:hypothetical protein
MRSSARSSASTCFDFPKLTLPFKSVTKLAPQMVSRLQFIGHPIVSSSINEPIGTKENLPNAIAE